MRISQHSNQTFNRGLISDQFLRSIYFVVNNCEPVINYAANQASLNRLNILYLSYDGMTDPLGQSQVLPYLGGLAKAGHRIALVSFEKPDRFKSTRQIIESFCNQHNIDWHPISYTK